MIHTYRVRVGVMGVVGRMGSREALRMPRGARTICRTRRGTEVATVLGTATASAEEPDIGEVLRVMTPSDELLQSRLERDRVEALSECEQRLRQRGIPAALVDAELLFDGGSLYFYFLGDPPAAAHDVTSELAEVYEAQAQLRQFSALLENGCGPGCGTDDAVGCGDACAVCELASGCRSRD